MNKRQSRSDQTDQSRSEQADQRMSGAIRVEHIRYGSIRSDQIELGGMIRLGQIRVKASGGKMRQIGAEQEHHGEREEPCQNRKENCNEKIRAEIKKSSVEQRGASIVLHKKEEQGEYPIG